MFMVNMVKCPVCGHVFTSPIQGDRTISEGESVIIPCPKCRNHIDVRVDQI